MCARGLKRLPAEPGSLQPHLHAQLFGGGKKIATAHSLLPGKSFIFHKLSNVMGIPGNLRVPSTITRPQATRTRRSHTQSVTSSHRV